MPWPLLADIGTVGVLRAGGGLNGNGLCAYEGRVSHALAPFGKAAHAAASSAVAAVHNLLLYNPLHLPNRPVATDTLRPSPLSTPTPHNRHTFPHCSHFPSPHLHVCVNSLAAPLLCHEVELQQLLLHTLNVSARLVDLVDGDNNRHA